MKSAIKISFPHLIFFKLYYYQSLPFYHTLWNHVCESSEDAIFLILSLASFWSSSNFFTSFITISSNLNYFIVLIEFSLNWIQHWKIVLCSPNKSLTNTVFTVLLLKKREITGKWDPQSNWRTKAETQRFLVKFASRKYFWLNLLALFYSTWSLFDLETLYSLRSPSSF